MRASRQTYEQLNSGRAEWTLSGDAVHDRVLCACVERGSLGTVAVFLQRTLHNTAQDNFAGYEGGNHRQERQRLVVNWMIGLELPVAENQCLGDMRIMSCW